MQTKKSQATLLPILGIVIVMLAIILIFLSVSQKIQVETSARVPASIEPIKTYVTQCLDKTARDGMVILGRQGGTLLTTQGGLTNLDPGDYIEDGGLKVIYRLKNMLPPTPGAEPYGKNFLPAIDQDSGLAGTTIKEQIESYIKNNIEDCTNFGEPSDKFKERGFEITRTGEIIPSVVFTNGDTVANLNMPLKIKSIATSEETTIDKFSKTINFRIRLIRGVVDYLINEDIFNKDFDIKGNHVKPHVKTISKDVDGDIVIITDGQDPTVGNEPFVFQFARENRKPELNIISYTTSFTKEIDAPDSISADGKIKTFTINGYEICSVDCASDPDEDSVTVNIPPVEFNFDVENEIVPSQKSNTITVTAIDEHGIQNKLPLTININFVDNP